MDDAGIDNLVGAPTRPGAGDIDGIHHLGLIGRDLARLALVYERLGFQLTPLSLPRIPLTAGGRPEPLGVGNRCAILRNGYLELLGVVDPACWSAVPIERRGPFDIDRPLAAGEGLHVLHLQSADLDLTRLRLIEEGLEPSVVAPFSREVDTPGGPRTMRARSLSFPAGRFPEALFQIAKHDTPDLVLQPRYMIHANGASALTGIQMNAVDPEGVANRYERYVGRPACRIMDRFEVRLPGFTISIELGDRVNLEPQGAGNGRPAFLSGLSVAADLDRARACFDERGVAYESLPQGLRVAADHAGGATVLFERGP